MQSMDEYKKLPEVRAAELDAPYKELVDHFNQQPLIAVINDRMRYFEEQGYQTLLAKMVEMANPKPAAASKENGEPSTKVAEQKLNVFQPEKSVFPSTKPGWRMRLTSITTWSPCAKPCWKRSAKEKGFRSRNTNGHE